MKIAPFILASLIIIVLASVAIIIGKHERLPWLDAPVQESATGHILQPLTVQ